MLRKASFTCPCLFLVIGLLLLIAQRAGASALTGGGNSYLSATVLQFIVFLIPAFLFCRLRDPDYLRGLNLRPVGVTVIGITLLSVLVMVSGTWLIRIAQITLSAGGLETPLRFTRTLPASGDVLSAGIAFCLIPAVCEELVFRSVLLCRYSEDRFGAFCVGAVTSALFAMLHFEPAQFFPLFWNGLTLYLLTAVTRSVFPAMAAHFLYNIYAVFGEKYVLTMMRSTYSVGILLFVCAVLFLLFLAGYFGQCERVLNEHADLDRPTPEWITARRKQLPTRTDRILYDLRAILSPSFLCCVLLYFIAVLTA